MDDQRLGELFRAAAGDVPPASFDEKDIAAASQRITQRRHSMLLGGGGLAVVLLAVGLVFGIGALAHTVGGSAVNSGAAAGVPGPVSTERGPFAAPGIVRSSPGASPMQGGGVTGKVGPGADGTHIGCGPVDGDLAVALASEIPSAGARAPVPASVLCPEGSRSAAISVPGGVVTAVLVPVRSAFNHPGLSLATTGAWAVLVESTPTSAFPAAQLARIQQRLAAKY